MNRAMNQAASRPVAAPDRDPELEMSIAELKVHAGQATRLLKALANESRLMILCNLAGGEMTVGQLNSHVDLSQSALSQHLALLRRDGLVKTRRQAQTIYYSLVEGPAQQVIGVLHDIYCPLD